MRIILVFKKCCAKLLKIHDISHKTSDKLEQSGRGVYQYAEIFMDTGFSSGDVNVTDISPGVPVARI